MTLEEATTRVREVMGVDPRALLFGGSVDEFACGADPDSGYRYVVWLNHTANPADRREEALARFYTYEAANAYMTALLAATGVSTPL